MFVKFIVYLFLFLCWTQVRSANLTYFILKKHYSKIIDWKTLKSWKQIL